MPIVSQNVDGNETLADNVCDNAALRISWLGYQLWMEDWGAEQKLPGVNLTISQVFYTLYAQVQNLSHYMKEFVSLLYGLFLSMKD